MYVCDIKCHMSLCHNFETSRTNFYGLNFFSFFFLSANVTQFHRLSCVGNLYVMWPELYSAGEAMKAETELCFWCVFCITECNLNQITEDKVTQFTAFCTFRYLVLFHPIPSIVNDMILWSPTIQNGSCAGKGCVLCVKRWVMWYWYIWSQPGRAVLLEKAVLCALWNQW